MLTMPFNSAGEGCAFSIPAYLHQPVNIKVVVNFFYRLFNYRSFVQVGRNIMSCGSNDFHATHIGLSVGIGTFEARKKGMTSQAMQVEDLLDEMLNSELHKWYIGKMDPEELKKRKEAAEEFRQRYSTE